MQKYASMKFKCGKKAAICTPHFADGPYPPAGPVAEEPQRHGRRRWAAGGRAPGLLVLSRLLAAWHSRGGALAVCKALTFSQDSGSDYVTVVCLRLAANLELELFNFGRRLNWHEHCNTRPKSLSPGSGSRRVRVSLALAARRGRLVRS